MEEAELDVKPESSTGEGESQQEQVTQQEVEKLREENQRLKENLRNQSKKRQPLASLGDSQESSDEEDEVDVSNLKAKVEQLEKAVLHNESRYEEHAVKWMSSQEWGKDYDVANDPDGKKYNSLSAAFQRVRELHPIVNEEDYKRNLKLADMLVRGDVESEVSVNVDSHASEKGAAGGSTGSTVRHESRSTEHLSDADLQLLRRRGLKPEDIK